MLCRCCIKYGITYWSNHDGPIWYSQAGAKMCVGEVRGAARVKQQIKEISCNIIMEYIMDYITTPEITDYDFRRHSSPSGLSVSFTYR